MLEQLTDILLTPVDYFGHQIQTLLNWLVMKGVQEDHLIIMFAVFGVSVLILVLGLLLGLFKTMKVKSDKSGQKKQPKKAKNPAEAERIKGPDPRFAIFKKRKNKTKAPDQAQPPATQAAETAGDQRMTALTEIERDMLALKELFDSGHINAELYVEETRKLYDQAQEYK